MNINKFNEQFNKEYQFLYDHDDHVAGYEEAVEAFDDFMLSHMAFILEFVNFRGDYITSDREAGAFMFALEATLAQMCSAEGELFL